ncbi:acyl-CoA dehydrogenase family protein [Sulfitobacter mediterraneus]|jgi:alkylation response protein AidB-like acyl-CoA dehydrogenase|uniref:acyl-CoA dehydrogenase family protein n=1 Tax=Sulfitobacter mediterraneus TaxID=83219 RepID=UPI00193146DE|nr:acyl-CoA dehydrogenase [Sulfitobacter mediterraneus]MBM1634428.1 acyl-CoA dehydrogenase family protein [Sulfitobacter mediterraneus]MBM1642245.1 acyl-CoA dehydrogenase family protein [Sulfitobacter mediterraneus]MBM1646294.1 acyl-CoA dehydrogenase family protein [Sulfitobacter mediterraneus]MBM1650340.1 acyl-CoA dehydrogenase family protein [Sulfitobacter mediterraneus]MBM1654362.1 acyl-CoA dehydrogenase family protein [Sulfitobacter mediterraneus]
MNFDLTEERQMLQDTLRRFLRDRYDTATRNAILDSDSGMSSDIWAQLAELGVIGALFTEEQGGFGGKGFDLAVVFEELGRAGVVEPVLDSAVLAGGLLADLGDEAQQAHVETLIGGGLHMALAHGEPSSRYDLNRVQTTAKTDGDAIVLNGHKAVVVNAEAADYLVVSARESGAVDDEAGISLFLVPSDAKGLTIQGYALLAGGRAAEVMLDNVQLTAADRLGEAGNAFAAIEARMAAASVAQCAETLGAMETATELTRDYLGTRKQFGRPIGTFQALAHRFSDLLIEMEQARSAVINAAGHLEEDRKLREINVSATKNLMGRAGRLVAEESIQMHGGIAMTQEYELAHIAKRITMADHRFGDTDHHLERFIALAAA